MEPSDHDQGDGQHRPTPGRRPDKAAAAGSPRGERPAKPSAGKATRRHADASSRPARGRRGLRLPGGPPPGPARPGFWRSPLRGPWLTSVFGLILLVGITVLFVTGLLSYAAYNPDLAPGNDQTPDKGLARLLPLLLADQPRTGSTASPRASMSRSASC